MPLWLWGIVIAVAIYYIWEVFAGSGVRYGGDTYNYLKAMRFLSQGHTDMLRPPVYPAVMLICRTLFGQFGGDEAVVVLQWCVWLAAMRLLWSLCAMMRINYWLSAGVILCQCAVREVVMINSTILTESLAMSGVIAVMYLSARIVCDYRPWQTWLLWAMVFIMIFLKPVFLILIPVVAVFFIARRPYLPRRAMAVSLAALIMIMSSAGVYVCLMHRSYGLWSMTAAAYFNDYHDLRMHGLIIPDELEEPWRSIFEPYYAADKGTDKPDADNVWYFSEGFELSSFGLAYTVDREKSLHRSEYLTIKLRKFVTTLPYSVFWLRYDTGNNEYQPDNYTHDPYFPYWGALLIFFVYMAGGVRRWWLMRKFPALLYMPAAIWAAVYFASIWGSHAEWSRLILPALPCMFVMAAAVLTALMRRYLKASGAPDTKSLT